MKPRSKVDGDQEEAMIAMTGRVLGVTLCITRKLLSDLCLKYPLVALLHV